MQKPHTYTSSSWATIAAIIDDADKDFDAPIILMGHGFATRKDRWSTVTISEALVGEWIATMRIDFYGHGESDGKLEDITMTEAVDDVVCGVRYLQKLWYTHIWLYGSSFWWCSVLNAACELGDEIAFVIGRCPLSDYAAQRRRRLWPERIKKWKETGIDHYHELWIGDIALKYSFYESMLTMNVHERANQMVVPVGIVHGDADEVSLIEQSIKTAELISDCELQIIPWAGHRFAEPEHKEQMMNYITDFAVRQFAPYL